MRRLLVTTLLLALSTLAAACQPPRSVKEVIIQRDIPIPGDGQMSDERMGGVDGGGGASYRGRPIDSYRVDILARANEADGILRAIGRVALVNRRFAAVMLHIARERSWMMIPGDLDRIPSLKMGIHVETDQVAIHKMREVWINSKLFDGMSLPDRQTLLVHEVIMGVRFMEFSNEFDRCVARATEHLVSESVGAEGADAFHVERRKCVSDERRRLFTDANSGILGSVRINDDDNAMIRKLTSLLMDPSAELPGAEELDLWLVRGRVITPSTDRGN